MMAMDMDMAMARQPIFMIYLMHWIYLMSCIYVIHLMCWNYMIDLITRDKNRKNKNNIR